MIHLCPKVVRNLLLRISDTEVSFARRGFEPSSLQPHLEEIGRSFLVGYHLALDDATVFSHGTAISNGDPTYQGFVFEGAAMAFAITDSLSLRKRNQWQQFLDGVGAPHRYVVHVGLGWAYARIPWYRRNPEKYMDRFDPLLKWLVLDGYGFHEGFFNWKKWLSSSNLQPPWSDQGKRVFDQGLGRSLWFVKGADVAKIAAVIESMHPSRRPDFWSGIGLAAAYAGDASCDEIESLVEASGNHRDYLAQGVTFGAEARELADIQAEHTDRICKIVCGMSASDAAELTRSAKPTFPRKHSDYETWRSNIRESLRSHVTT